MQNFNLQPLFSSDSLALRVGGRDYSYGEWAKVIEAYRLTIRQELPELPEKAQVGILLSGPFPALNVMLALWILRAVPVWIPTTFPLEKIKELVNTFQLKQLIVDTEILHTPIGIPCLDVKVLAKKAAYFLGQHQKIEDESSWSFPFEQKSAVLFSSGSLGEPKAVHHTMGTFFHSARGSIEFYQMEAADLSLCSLPLHHIGGLMIPIRSILCGGTIVISSSELASKLEKGLSSEGISYLSLVPTQLIRLLDNQRAVEIMQSMKAVILGGAPIGEWPYQKAQEKKIPLSLSYGLTEMGAQVTASLPGQREQRLLPYRQIKVSSIDQEILVGGATLAPGCPLDEEGWFHTGDLGELSADGALTVLGRKDLMFKSGGESVHPRMIEQTIKEIPWVIEAIVVPIPHYQYGAVAVAFIESARKLSVMRILNYLKQKLPAYMIPKNVIFLSEDNRFKNLKYNRKSLEEYAKTL